MKREELRWCLLFSVILIVITTIPYVVALQAPRNAWSFTGSVFGVGDGNSYIAKMLQGHSGAWLFRTPYSSEGGRGVLAFLPYLLLGKLAGGPEIHLQLVLLFHAARLLLIPLLVWSAYRFAAMFLVEPTWRRWATALACAGGGLGWLLALTGQSHAFGSLPLDFISPEAFGFLAIYGLPHLILSRSLLLLAIVAYLVPGEGLRPAAGAGVLLLAAGLVQPLTVASAYAAIGVHLGVLWALRFAGRSTEAVAPWARKAALAIVISLPLAAYYAIGSVSDPALQRWAAQNILTSPHPAHYFLAYILVLLPAFIGARALIRLNPAHGLFLVVWVLSLMLMAYAPLTVQRRMTEGVWVALSVLAAKGLSVLPIDESQRRVVGGGILVLAVLTSLFLLGGGLGQSLRPSIPVFRPAAEVAAFEWIGENVAPGSVVLAAFDTGNALPAWAPVRSVIGHGPETANLDILQPEVEAFYRGDMPAPEADRFLTNRHVAFVLRGPAERQWGAWGRLPSDRLELVYEQSGYAVYAVESADG